MSLVYLFVTCGLVVTVGDPLFARAMRKHAPSAFAAAGSPSSGNLAVLTPYFFSPYHRFIIRRAFRSHLQAGTALYRVATLLFVAHALLLLLAFIMVLVAVWLWLTS